MARQTDQAVRAGEVCPEHRDRGAPRPSHAGPRPVRVGIRRVLRGRAGVLSHAGGDTGLGRGLRRNAVPSAVPGAGDGGSPVGTVSHRGPGGTPLLADDRAGRRLVAGGRICCERRPGVGGQSVGPYDRRCAVLVQLPAPAGGRRMASAPRRADRLVGTGPLGTRAQRVVRGRGLVRLLRRGAVLPRSRLVVDSGAPAVSHPRRDARRSVLLRRTPMPGSPLAGVVLGHRGGQSGRGLGRPGRAADWGRVARLARRRRPGPVLGHAISRLPAGDSQPARATRVQRRGRHGTNKGSRSKSGREAGRWRLAARFRSR